MTTANITANSVFTLALSALLGACLEHDVKEVAYEKVVVAPKLLELDINRDVDILFVIDNSGSMAEEQQRVAENFAAFINVLEAEDVGANYRIGITTTDAGNPRCPSTTPTTRATPATPGRTVGVCARPRSRAPSMRWAPTRASRRCCRWTRWACTACQPAGTRRSPWLAGVGHRRALRATARRTSPMTSHFAWA